MAKNAQVNIRFDDATADQLEATAAELGLSVSALVRHATRLFLEDIKRTGSVRISEDTIRILGRADARTEWGFRKIETSTAVLNDAPNSEAVPSKGRVNYSNQKKRKKKDE